MCACFFAHLRSICLLLPCSRAAPCVLSALPATLRLALASASAALGACLTACLPCGYCLSAVVVVFAMPAWLYRCLLPVGAMPDCCVLCGYCLTGSSGSVVWSVVLVNLGERGRVVVVVGVTGECISGGGLLGRSSAERAPAACGNILTFSRYFVLQVIVLRR